MIDNFSPREFLRQRQALLVHFSTVMASHPDLMFPNDLRNAMTLRNASLSFSTIFVGDTNPHVAGRGGAEGSVGLLVDIGLDTIIESVLSGDSGSSAFGSLGLSPTQQNCADSIDQRVTSNEWRIQNYIPRGIFILPPILVRQRADIEGMQVFGEVKLSLEQAIAPFPEQSIFSADLESFFEYDRETGWKRVKYNEIIPADQFS